MEIYVLIEVQSDGHIIPIMATRHKSNIEEAKRMWGKIKSKQDDEVWLEDFRLNLDSFIGISDMIEDEEQYQAMMSEYRNTLPEPN